MRDLKLLAGAAQFDVLHFKLDLVNLKLMEQALRLSQVQRWRLCRGLRTQLRLSLAAQPAARRQGFVVFVDGQS